jgi:hypothetical protein
MVTKNEKNSVITRVKLSYYNIVLSKVVTILTKKYQVNLICKKDVIG